MPAYNLTKSQVQLIHKLVESDRRGELEQPILPIEGPNKHGPGFMYFIPAGATSIQCKGSYELDGLCDAGLLGIQMSNRGSKLYYLKQNAYDFVDGHTGEFSDTSQTPLRTGDVTHGVQMGLTPRQSELVLSLARAAQTTGDESFQLTCTFANCVLRSIPTGYEISDAPGDRAIYISLERQGFIDLDPTPSSGLTFAIRWPILNYGLDISQERITSMNQYNITSSQKELLRQLVQYVRDNKLEESFELTVTSNLGNIISVKGEDNIQLDSSSDLDALTAVQLLQKHPPNGYAITPAAREAVDNDFAVPLAANVATQQPINGMWVNPVFGAPQGTKYAYDIFVLMPFKECLAEVYEDHMRKVAKELELTIARADDFFSTESIISEIWAAIAQSRILIADCTGKNPNVFYEMGIAHAIGKQVVLITKNPEDVPFDIGHIRHIRYQLTPRGMKEFEDTLKKTLESCLRSH